jgi:hypothetical protein
MFDLKPLHSVELPKGHRAEIYDSDPDLMSLGKTNSDTYSVLVYDAAGHPAMDAHGPDYMGLTKLQVKKFLEVWVCVLTLPPEPRPMSLGELLGSMGQRDFIKN